MNIKHCGVVCTKNRHKCLERVVTCFLKQTYKHSVLLIFNNSIEELNLDTREDYSESGNIILINNHLNPEGQPYTSLGEIYNHAIQFIPKDTKVVSFMDDDDIFLENYVEEGVRGLYMHPDKLAYKPEHSYFKTHKGVGLAKNVLEPSIFVDYSHLMSTGFFERNVDLHHKWLQPLIDEKLIYVDKTGAPTFIYDWSGEIFVWKTSGDPKNPDNFDNYNKWSVDVGDGIISPVSDGEYKMFTRV